MLLNTTANCLQRRYQSIVLFGLGGEEADDVEIMDHIKDTFFIRAFGVDPFIDVEMPIPLKLRGLLTL